MKKRCPKAITILPLAETLEYPGNSAVSVVLPSLTILSARENVFVRVVVMISLSAALTGGGTEGEGDGGGGGGDGGGDDGGGDRGGGGAGGDGGGGAAGGTIPANRASSARLMPLAVRKSAARSSPEHVSFSSPTPTHRNGSTPSTLVLNAMAVWRPEMRSSFAVVESGGRGQGAAAGASMAVGL